MGDNRQAMVLLQLAAAMEKQRQCRRAVAGALRSVVRGETGADEALETLWGLERRVAADVLRLRGMLTAAAAEATTQSCAGPESATVLTFARAA